MDTNVLIAYLSGEPRSAAQARRSLEEASRRGNLLISPAVYAELVAEGRGADVVKKFLRSKEIAVVWDTNRSIWQEAGHRYGVYARERRKRGGDSEPRRILADFLIGAHALDSSGSLLTSDRNIFATYFPELEILMP